MSELDDLNLDDLNKMFPSDPRRSPVKPRHKKSLVPRHRRAAAARREYMRKWYAAKKAKGA